MKKTFLGIALLTVGLTGAAIAQGPGARPDPMGDKTVSKAEAQARAGEMFVKMDANKDGKLDTADRTAHKAQMHGQMFDKLDANKDGAVSRAEFSAAREQRQAGAPGEGREGREGRRGKHGGHGKAGGMMLKMADANKDGAVGREEFIAAHAKMFDMADANKDGQLTAAERQAHHAKMREHMGKRGKGDHAGHGDTPPPPPAN